MPARRALLVGSGLAALLAVWFALWPIDGSPVEPTADAPQAPVRAEIPAARPVAPVRSAEALQASLRRAERPPAAPTEPDETAPDETAQGLSPVEAYRRYAVYPPTSRPLHANQSDLIDWNRRHESPRADPDDAEVAILFTADRYHVVGEQTLSPLLDVRRAGEPATVQVLDSRVHLPDGRALPFALEPRDGLYAGVIAPAAWGLTATARIEVEAAFDAGSGPRTARFFATYTPDDAVPARFGAALGDRVVDGSLEVTVEVHVERAGLYLFDANLFAAGEPVAWTRSKPHLEPGTHGLTLRFFGKAIADRGLDGPFTVEQLRGALAAPGSTPATVQMPPYDGAIPTAAHTADAFSPAEWDDPRKQRRIARLKRLEAMGGPTVTTPAWRDEAPR